MRICIPTQSKDGKKSKVNEHFGSAPYFAIYDTDDSTLEFIENTNAHHSHGMCQPIAALREKNIEIVICGGMGAGVLRKLNQQVHLSADIAYNDGTGANCNAQANTGVDHDWSHAVLGVSTEFEISDDLTFAPGIYYQISMDDSVNNSDECWVGLSFTYSF